MAINTYDSTGYTIDAKITLGLNKDKITLDISRYVTNISYSFTNFELLPELELNYLLDIKYANLVSLPYELDLTIIEKGGNSGKDIPRGQIKGKFVCFPESTEITNKSNDANDTIRLPIDHVFFPKDLISLLNSEISLSSSGNISSILTKLFKTARKSGGVSLKLGKLNTTQINNLALTRNKFHSHLVYLYNTYGFTNQSPIWYADFNNIYVQSVNDTLVGDSTPITLYFDQDNTNKNYTIDNHYYLLRTPPAIDTDLPSRTLEYSKDVVLLLHPRTTIYKKKTLDLKKLAQKDKTISKTDNYKYFDQIKKTKTRLIAGNDNILTKQNALSADVSYNLITSCNIIDPMIITDFVIGRKVKYDTSITDFFGFEMTGYIISSTISLASNNGVKWDGICSLEIANTSTGGVLK
jgi:hypothetical protein